MADQDPGPTPSGDGQSRRGRPRRVLALWGGAAAAALVAGGIAIGAVNANVYSPEAHVERYLDALAAGDGATALGLATAAERLAPGTATPLLDGEPLAAGFEALGDVEVTRGEESAGGDAVEVLVGYTVDGQDHRTTFTVDRAGRDWLFFDRWRMAPMALPTVRVAPTSWPPEAAGRPMTATVNGAGARPAQDVAVLPPAVLEGAYSSTYLEAAPERVIVDGTDPEDPATLDLAVRYTDAVQAEADRQLDEYLAGCTGQEVLNPTGCPMGYQTLNRVPPESISWSLAEDPDVELAPLGGSEDPESADPTVARPVEVLAVLTLDEVDLVTGERRTVEAEDPVRLEADLQVSPESVRYTPRVP